LTRGCLPELTRGAAVGVFFPVWVGTATPPPHTHTLAHTNPESPGRFRGLLYFVFFSLIWEGSFAFFFFFGACQRLHSHAAFAAANHGWGKRQKKTPRAAASCDWRTPDKKPCALNFFVCRGGVGGLRVTAACLPAAWPCPVAARRSTAALDAVAACRSTAARTRALPPHTHTKPRSFFMYV
jgi:hypothetical protein